MAYDSILKALSGDAEQDLVTNPWYVGGAKASAMDPTNPYEPAWKNILANISKAGVSYKRQSKGRYILSYQAKEILSALDMMNPKRRHHISDKINLYSFLSGLIDTDGYVRSDNAVLITGTKHLKTLSDKLQALGLPGVKFYLYRNKGDKTNIGSTTKDSYALRISAQSMAMLSPNLCSVKCADIDFGRDFSYNKQNVAKIIGIEYAGRQHVYDIHVPKVNRFVAESVVVHNCERHVYKWEYALWHHGASQIIFGNGKPPVLTNPSLVPGCCKHVYRILTAMRNRKL
jgi:Fe-S cluster biosynthesis and repair protein YggX